jgi:hypothetical protein
LYVELPYGDETHAVPICKEITLGFHVEVGLQLLTTVQGALGDVASGAAEAGSQAIIRTGNGHVTHRDDTDDVLGGCDMALFLFLQCFSNITKSNIK